MKTVITKHTIDILPVSSERANSHELVGEAIIVDICSLGVKFKTSGHRGGEAGGDSYLEVTLTDEDGCSIRAASDGLASSSSNVFIGFYGDGGIKAAMDAFEFLATSLRKHIGQISEQ